ncbi:hypothetical protein Dip510_001006 [Elusimicrobium posterum]|uniref:hypothetical protein n=1 Tax=Elusimicrobium posterum TaxID=3116653 RepID=UPI003C778F3C
MKKVFLVLFAAAFVFTACSKAVKTDMAAAQPQQTQQAQAQMSTEPFDMVVIKTDVVPNVGGETPALTQGLANMWMKAPANVTTVDYAQAKDDPQFAGIDMTFMPVYLIKATDKAKEAFAQPINNGMLKVINDYIVFSAGRQEKAFIWTKKRRKMCLKFL